MVSLCDRIWTFLRSRRDTKVHATKPLLGSRRHCKAGAMMVIYEFYVLICSARFLFLNDSRINFALCPRCSYLLLGMLPVSYWHPMLQHFSALYLWLYSVQYMVSQSYDNKFKAHGQAPHEPYLRSGRRYRRGFQFQLHQISYSAAGCTRTTLLWSFYRNLCIRFQQSDTSLTQL